MHLNVQCLSTKVDQLLLFLEKNDYDILCFSEHWANEFNLKLVNIFGYKLSNFFCRSNTVHGGTSIFVKSSISIKKLNLTNYCQEVDAEFSGILLPTTQTAVVCLYRSCLGDFNIFLKKFEDLLDYLISASKKIVILCDFIYQL